MPDAEIEDEGMKHIHPEGEVLAAGGEEACAKDACHERISLHSRGDERGAGDAGELITDKGSDWRGEVEPPPHPDEAGDGKRRKRAAQDGGETCGLAMLQRKQATEAHAAGDGGEGAVQQLGRERRADHENARKKREGDAGPAQDAHLPNVLTTPEQQRPDEIELVLHGDRPEVIGGQGAAGLLSGMEKDVLREERVDPEVLRTGTGDQEGDNSREQKIPEVKGEDAQDAPEE